MKRNLLVLFVLLMFGHYSYAQPCVGSQSITATPLPLPNGTYTVGTVVTFCYSVSNYSQTGADWIAGVVPTLGPAWIPASLQPVSAAASCDGQGNWAWYTSCTGTASGQTYGPGFYYDSPAGATSGVLDGIPGNNYGDNCQNNTWTFCFEVEVGQCIQTGSGSLYFAVTALSDYSAGSWGTNACIDPPYSYGNIQCANNCALIVQSINITNATCHNTSDGSITAIPSGVPPYTYLWSNGATTQTVNNLAPGIYTLTVTDSAFCVKTVTIPVGGPQPISLNATVVDNLCDTIGASITLAPTGGTGSTFTYQWNNGASGTAAITNLTGGTYIVTVTDSNNCVEIDTFNITSVIPLDLVTSTTSTACGSSNGSASVTASGGTGPYTYDWQPSGGNGSTASNLMAGFYTVTVTDTNGCTASETVEVLALGLFNLTTSFVPLGCDPQGSTTATVIVSGGTAPFTYQWLPTGGNSATATGLSAGSYSVVVIDSSGCVDTAFVIIPSIIPITLSSSSTSVQCNQPSSGTATVTVLTGPTPYTYLWSNGSTSSTATNLAGGTYTVTVTDGNGCTAVETVLVNVIPDVFANAGTDQTVCNGDPATITAVASGGTAPFNYSWNNGVNNSGQTVNPSTTTTYTVTISDANNCTATSSVTVIVIDYPVVTVSSDVDICDGGSTTLTSSGGATYSWSPANGLNDPNVANPVANPSSTTTYTVTVSNGNCSSTGTVTVTVIPQAIAAFSPDTIQGQAPLSVHFTNNSVNSTSYFWDFGDGNTSTNPDPDHIYTAPGNYIVELIATNSLGCDDTIRYSFIVVELNSSLFIPNIFTPNGDNLNDTFSLQEKGIASIKVNILNRWGKEVYSWNINNGSWGGKSKDGTELPEGTYVYIINAKGVDGKDYNFEGTVQLIRNKN